MDILQKFFSIVNQNVEIKFDGAIHRFGEKDVNWYVAHEWTYNGKPYQIIKVGSWNGSLENQTLKSWDHREETQSFRKKYADITRQADADLKVQSHEKNKQCKEKWHPIFRNAKVNSNNEYLKYKNIEPFCSKTDHNGVLLIPAYDSNGFTGVQRIFKDPETGKFVKRFSKGIKKEFSICHLKSFKDSEFCFLSEGFATAASIQMAFPEIPSICAFDSGNLEKAIATIRGIAPKIKIIIAADKDKNKVGEFKAKKCTEKWPDVIYRVAQTDSEDWTDFNDLHCFQSLNDVKEQLAFDETDFESVRAIGFIGDDFFFTSSSNPQIVSTTSKGMSKNFLFSLAPQKYWAKKYGFEQDEKIIIPWDNVTSNLLEDCRRVGFFNPQKIRGLGVWKDGEKYVVNNGESVFNPSKESKHIYQRGVPFYYPVEIKEKKGEQFFIDIIKTFKELKYKNKGDYVWLVAYLFQAQVYSVMDWRFQLWLTGSRGSGKSQILETIKDMTQNPFFTANTTAAGVIQKIKNNASPVFFDESEADSERMRNILELMRQMSKNGDFITARGTSSGNSVVHNTNTIFCFASIQVSNLNAADRSRIFVVEMDSVKDQQREDWEIIKDNFDYFIQNKDQIFYRAYKNIKTVKENQKKICDYLKDNFKMESRLADQVSHAFAFFYLAISEDEISEEYIEFMMEEAHLQESAYIVDNKEDDESNCYDHLMSVMLDNQNNTVARAIQILNGNNKLTIHEEFQKMLNAHGIRHLSKGLIFVSSKNQHLLKKMGNYINYSSILKRSHLSVKKSTTQRINDVVIKGFEIKVSDDVEIIPEPKEEKK